MKTSSKEVNIRNRLKLNQGLLLQQCGDDCKQNLIIINAEMPLIRIETLL